jgi:hypothetical protein
MKLNTARIWLGGIAGGVVWIAWGFFIGIRQAPFYAAMQKQGLFLQQPRYEPFAVFWIVLIFAMSILIAYLYAWARATTGAGPKTALKDVDKKDGAKKFSVKKLDGDKNNAANQGYEPEDELMRFTAGIARDPNFLDRPYRPPATASATQSSPPSLETGERTTENHI